MPHNDHDHPLALASTHLTNQHLQDLSAITHHPAIHPDSRARVATEITGQFTGIVQHQIMRLVINAFHAFREEHGWDPDPTTDRALKAYADKLANDPSALTAIWAGANRLHPRLAQLAERTVRVVTEILDNFISDRPALIAHGLMSSEDLIAGLGLAQGDTHAGGRSVAMVHLTSGDQIVYKPRSLVLDEHLPKLWGLLDADLQHSLVGCVPLSASCGDHGWQAYVTRNADLSRADCERFYYRFGALTAIAGLWGSTDLHHENVIVHGDHPLIIDSETVLQPDIGTGDALDPAAQKALSATPLGTLLLPVRSSASVIDLLMSGLGVPWEQTSEQTVFQVADENSDAFSIRRQQWSVTQEANVPRVDGKPQNPLVWYSALKSGYLDALSAVRRREDELAEALRSLPPETTVRHVFRATEVYSRFLDALTHPEQWTSQEPEDEVLNLLSAPSNAGLDLDWLVESEKQQLRQGDVPLFSAGVHETRAIGHGLSPHPVFVASAVDAAIERTHIGLRLSEEMHMLVLETCCSELGQGPAPCTVHDALFRPLLGSLDPDDWCAALSAVALRTTDSSGAEDWGWYGGTGIGGNTFDAGSSVSLHDLGGPAAFLRRYHQATGKAPSAARAAVRGWRRRADLVAPVLTELPWSVLGGSASAPLIVGTEGIDFLLAGLNAPDTAPAAQPMDVAHGSAGLIALLSGVTPNRAVKAVLTEHAERVAHTLAEATPAPDHNLLHGRLGLWWGLLRAGRALGRDSWVEQARDALEKAAASLPDDAPRGWCNGAAGVALAAADAGLPEATVDAVLERAMDLDPAHGVDLSVCHGEAGVAQVTAWVEHARGGAPTRAREHLSRAFAAALEHGFRNGMHGHTALLGYALGWSGVADTVLLLNQPDAHLGHPVALEVDPRPSTPIESGSGTPHSALLPSTV